MGFGSSNGRGRSVGGRSKNASTTLRGLRRKLAKQAKDQSPQKLRLSIEGLQERKLM